MNVPYAEKDAAKRLGARWDAARKTWYVENIENLELFTRWMPGGKLPENGRQIARKKFCGSRRGENFISPDCDCLPWIGCEICKSH